MKGRTPAFSRLAVIAPTLVITAGVIGSFIADFGPQGWGRGIALMAFSGSQRMPRIYQQIDDFFLHQMPSGNIWVRFEGYDPKSDADKIFMERIYYRGNYAVYPRRLYVSGPATVVNNGEAMVPTNDVPDKLLAERLGIEWFATFSRGIHGEVYWTAGRWK